ncbi:MAG TPA: hypothetical protein VK436_08605 [Methanocella sp.]|nr:hypothetical protein [Methanocella sp.]
MKREKVERRVAGGAGTVKPRLFRHFDDEGVSEAIGTVLVFGIVLTGITIITVLGMSILNNSKDMNNFQNVEQGLKVVQSDMKRVALEKTPIKTTLIHTEGGSIYTDMTGSSTYVDFPGLSYHNTTGEVSYRMDSGKYVSLQNGGLWLSYGTNGTDQMVLSPRIFAWPDTGTLVVNVIRLAGTPSSYGGSGTMNIIMEYNDTEQYISPRSGTPQDAKITLDTRYPYAWGRFMQDSLEGFNVDYTVPSPDKVVITVHGVNQVQVSEHTVSIKPIVYTS